MSASPLPALLGSQHRVDRENPVYQEQTLRALCSFQQALLKSYVEQLADEQRRGREVWQGKQWLEGQLLASQAAERELREWAAQLEEARNWCDEQRKKWEATAEWYRKQLESQQARLAELERKLGGS